MICITFLYSKEYRLARQGNITKGKLKATDKTKPILITSLPNDVDRFIRILPENKYKLL